MYENSVFKKILELATEPVSLIDFQKKYLEKSTRERPIRVQWETLEGNQRYYWMWWEDGPIATTESGEKMSETKLNEGMFNIQTEESGKWRTLTLQTVSKFRVSGSNKIYTIK